MTRKRLRRTGFWLILAVLLLAVYVVFVLLWAQPLSPTSSVTPATTASSARIQLFFAPASPEATDGIDDHLLALLRSAREEILCAFYDLEFMPASEVLLERHAAGVRVYIVSDSDYADREALRACKAAGIPVVLDNRGALMHDKFCVVDKRFVWTGSTNITSNGMYRNNNNALLFDSEALSRNFAGEFGEMFSGNAFGPRSPRNTREPVLEAGGVRIECYFAPEDAVESVLLRHIAGANQRIDFMAFSFTSVPLAEAMAARMRDGVRVRGLFEKRNAGSPYSRDDFLAGQGASIHLDANPYTMHHKVILIDGAVVVTGSYNFSKSAETSNDENVVILSSPELVAAFTGEFESLFAQAS